MKFRCAALLCVICALLSSCGSEDSGTPSSEEDTAPDNTAEVQAYYKSRPDFFSFKTLADLPADLEWNDGMDLPEIGSPQAKKGGTEYGALADFPRTLRPVGPDSNGSFRPFVLDYVDMQFAHRHGNQFAFHPGLAREWAVDNARKTVYVKIDPQARWSDGERVTVDDVFFMFFMYQSSYIVAPWYNNWYSTMYTNVTRYDDLTFSVTSVTAKPDLDSRVLELRPLPRHFYRELGEDYVERYQWRFQPITGAYVIRDEDIKKGRSITLTRNTNWWAKDRKFWRYRYNPDRIHLTVIRDVAKSFEAFRAGNLDAFGLSQTEYWYDKLPNNDSLVQSGYVHKSVFYNQHPRPTYGLWINSARPLLDNREIRIGINYATNWDLVIARYSRGDWRRMNTASDGYGDFTHPNLRARPFDIDKAAEHFAKAGFTERGADGVLVNADGQRLSFSLTTGYKSFQDVLTILKEEALKAGLELRLEILDATASWKKAQEKKHDILFAAFGVALEMYPRFWETYHSDNAYDKAFLADGSVNPARKLRTQTNNLESLADSEMDRLIDAYRSSDDRDEMIQLAHEMEKLHYDYASFVPGFVQDFYRVGHWRWYRYPEDFNLKYSSGAGEFFVHWIDTQMKEETLRAKKAGETFPPQITVYDQYRLVVD